MSRIIVCFCLAILLGCSSSLTHRLTVGSKSSADQVLLGEIIAQHVERKLGAPVTRMQTMTGSQMVHQAMLTGQIDIYPESLNDAFTEVLNLPLPADDTELRTRLRSEYRRQFQAEWMEPLGFHTTFAMVLDARRPEFAAIHTLSDAVGYQKGWVLGASSEFLTRADGLGAMMDGYPLRWKASPRPTEPTQLYSSLEQKQVDLIAGTATDGQLLSDPVRVLEDDKHIFRPSDVAIVARLDALKLYPQLQSILQELSGKLSDSTVQEMNYEVGNRHQSVKAVAAEFLRKAALP